MKFKIISTLELDICPDDQAWQRPEENDSNGHPYFEINIDTLEELLALLSRHLDEINGTGYPTFNGGLLIQLPPTRPVPEIEIYDYWRE